MDEEIEEGRNEKESLTQRENMDPLSTANTYTQIHIQIHMLKRSDGLSITRRENPS